MPERGSSPPKAAASSPADCTGPTRRPGWLASHLVAWATAASRASAYGSAPADIGACYAFTRRPARARRSPPAASHGRPSGEVFLPHVGAEFDDQCGNNRQEHDPHKPAPLLHGRARAQVTAGHV